MICFDIFFISLYSVVQEDEMEKKTKLPMSVYLTPDQKAFLVKASKRHTISQSRILMAAINQLKDRYEKDTTLGILLG